MPFYDMQCLHIKIYVKETEKKAQREVRERENRSCIKKEEAKERKETMIRTKNTERRGKGEKQT